MINIQQCGVDIPAQLVGTLPYVVTIVVLAGFIGRSLGWYHTTTGGPGIIASIIGAEYRRNDEPRTMNDERRRFHRSSFISSFILRASNRPGKETCVERFSLTAASGVFLEKYEETLFSLNRNRALNPNLSSR